jgi:hypothetical protein
MTLWQRILAFFGSKSAQAIEKQVAAVVIPLVIPVAEKAIVAAAAANPVVAEVEAIVAPVISSEVTKLTEPPKE